MYKLDNNILTKQENIILNESLLYIEKFIQNSGSFYPFAMIMDKNEETFSIDPGIDEEFTDSETVIHIIEEYVNNEYKRDNNYTLTIICVDTFIHEIINGNKTKKDAIEIRFIAPAYKKMHYLGYETTVNNKLVIGDFIHIEDNK